MYIRKCNESDEPKYVEEKIRRNRNEIERQRKINISNAKQGVLIRDSV